jgi:protein phosphatase 2C family protein 2/3
MMKYYVFEFLTLSRLYNSQVFDGHGGKDAAQYVRDNLPRVIVEDAAFPLELEKVVRRSFVQTDSQFAEKCSIHDGLSSGTTALTAMIFGRYYFCHMHIQALLV